MHAHKTSAKRRLGGVCSWMTKKNRTMAPRWSCRIFNRSSSTFFQSSLLIFKYLYNNFLTLLRTWLKPLIKLLSTKKRRKRGCFIDDDGLSTKKRCKRGCFIDDNELTLHVPSAPNDVVQTYLVLPAQLQALEPVPFRWRELLAAKRERDSMKNDRQPLATAVSPVCGGKKSAQSSMKRSQRPDFLCPV